MIDREVVAISFNPGGVVTNIERFGLEDGRVWTLEEVRQRLGISRERVRQLQAQSLGRLPRPTPRRRLSRYLDAVAS